MNKELLSYFKGDELAAGVWKGKYALENETSPNQMHQRMAKEFARVEKEYQKQEISGKKGDWRDLSSYGQSRLDLTQESIYEMFKDFKYIVPQGSIMSTLGTDLIASLSNCWVVESPFDSYAGIHKTDGDLIGYYKRRGGCGADISNLRPNKTKTNNTAKSSTGAVSFMNRFSNTTREVAMNGRRGALMLSIDVRHPDVMDFIKIKRDLTQVTGANISIRISDEFMKAVENNEDFILKFPCNMYIDKEAVESYNFEYDVLENYSKGYVKKIKAKEYWNEIIKSAKDYAEPGLMYWDTALNYDPAAVYEQYKPICTNPCQPEWATVLTPDGIRTIGEVEIGDSIWSEEGWTTVINKWSTGIKDVYSYKTTSGEFIGTENHKLVSNGVKTEAKDCESIDSLTGNVESVLHNLQLVMDGLVLGDGGAHKASGNLRLLYIGEDDQDYHTSEIADFLVKERKGISPYAWEIKTNVLAKDLTPMYERVIPENYFKGTASEVASLLRGMYSANGSVVSNRVTYKTSSPILRDQIQLLLSSLGIRSYFTTNKMRDIKFVNGTYSCKESYDINISTDRAKFAKLIGFLQKYKNEKLNISTIGKAKINFPIQSVEYKSTEEVFDLTVDNNTHTYWTGGVNVSNCGEQFLNANDSCRLMATNLFSFVLNPFTENASINEDKLYSICYEALRLGDSLVDLEAEYIQRIINKVISDPEPEDIKRQELELWIKSKAKALAGRRVGLGITALGDMLAALGLKYDSEEALKVIDRVMYIKMKAELDATIDLSILRGSFDGWDAKLEENGNKFYKFVAEKFPEQSKRMKLVGRRNSNWSTVAPTGSVSILTQTSSGVEPLFMPYYMRRKKVNPNDKNVKIDFVDLNGDNWEEFAVMHQKFKDWVYIANPEINKVESLSKLELDKLFEKSPWYKSTANDIDWLKRVEIQAVLQTYTTNAISSTINLPSIVTYEDVSNIYLHGWKQGLKGQTVYVDGSRSGVLVDTSKEVKTNFEYKDAVKRPKQLSCDIYAVQSKGKKWNILVGLLEDKPYEVFIVNYFTEEKKLNLVKKARGKYDLHKGKEIYSENVTSEMSDEQAAITRLTSTSLRHGTDIKYVVEQLNKCEGDLYSFTKSLARTLKKYIPDGTKAKETCPDCGGTNVVYEEGCKTCKDCGSGKCG